MITPKNLVLISLALIALVAIIFISLPKTKPAEVVPSPTLQVGSNRPAVIPSGWQTRANEQLKYKISFPAGYKLTENGPNGVIIEKDVAVQGAGSANFIYLTVIPDDKLESSGGEFYNYNSREYRLLTGLMPEQSTSSGEIKDLERYYTYSRLPDEMISGLSSRVFMNSKPWEFPQGTVEYRYLINKSGNLYLLGSYTGSGESDDVITVQEFGEIKKTLAID